MKRAFYIVFIFFLFSFNKVSASMLEIENYDISLLVTEKNDYEITTNITFLSENQIIYFSYPVNKVSDDYHIQVEEVHVEGAEYTIQEDDEGLTIHLIQLYTESKKVVIRYVYHKGKNIRNGRQYFEYEYLLPQLKIPVHNFNAAVILSRNMITQNLDLRLIEKQGIPLNSLERDSKLAYSIAKDRISITSLAGLEIGEVIGLRFDLPKGYFSSSFILDQNNMLVLILLALISLFALFMWYVLGFNETVRIRLKSHPPNGLSPVEIGYMIDERLEFTDIYHMLLYWAEKGYLKVVDQGLSKEAANLHEFKVIKTDPMPKEVPAYEREMYDAFFELTEKEDEISTIHLKREASDSFGTLQYYTNRIEEIGEGIYETIRKKSNDAKSSHINRLISFFKLSIFAFWNILIFIDYYGYHMDIKDKTFLAFTEVILLILLFSQVRDTNKILNQVLFILLAAFSHFYFNMPWAHLVCMVALFLVTQYARNKTTKYTMLGREMRGFRQFIKEANEKDILRLQEENDRYFYEILPYALMFRRGDLWIEHFKKIDLKLPSWYETDKKEDFKTIKVFIKSIDAFAFTILKSINNAVDSKKNTDNEFGEEKGGRKK